MSALLKEPDAREKKPDYSDLPPDIFRQIEKLMGEKVIFVDIVYGGLSAAACYYMILENGRKIFIKGTHPGEMSHGAATLAQEVMTYETIEALQYVAPKYLGIVSDGEEDGWMLGVWDFQEHDDKYFDLEKIMALMPRWHSDKTAQNVLPLAKGHIYLGQFFNGEKKWLRLKNDAALRTKFIGIFADKAEATKWFDKNLPALLRLQAQADKMTGPLGLLHGDLRADNFIFTPDRAYAVDWPNAAYGPLAFDLAFLFSNLEALGFGKTEDFFAQYKAVTVPPADIAIMLACLSGYFADHAYRDVPEKMPRLRWMQKGMLLAQLKALARLGILESPPKMAGENQ